MNKKYNNKYSQYSTCCDFYLRGTKLVLTYIFSFTSLGFTTSYPSLLSLFIQVFIIFLLDYWNSSLVGLPILLKHDLFSGSLLTSR